MFDFNALFNQVFPGTETIFNPNENYYTVLVNCAGEPTYYEGFEAQRRMYLGDAYYKEMPVYQGTDIEAFRTQVMELGLNFSVKIQTSFLFLMDFAQSDYPKSFAKSYLQVVRQHKQPNDTVAVIAILPDDMRKSSEILNKLEQDVEENEILYLYHKQPYREKALSSGLCGIALLHSSQKLYAELRQKEKSNQQTLNSALAGLPEAGAAAIRAKRPLLWSSLGCSFQNPKMEFLRSYVAIMCNKVMTPDFEDYAKLCGEIYTGMAEDQNKGNLHKLLFDTVSHIPRVAKNPPKYDGYTLEAYFEHLYGGDGMKMVELSFKVTLAMMPTNVLNENVIVNVSNALFERAARYHSPDLYADVCRFLEEYRNAFKRKYDSIRNTAVKFAGQHAENDSFEEDLQTYIDNYIKYYDVQKQNDFWSGVESYVRNHRSNFDSYCEKSRRSCEELMQLKQELQFRQEVPIDKDAVRCYPVHDVLEVASNPSICREIAATYTEPHGNARHIEDVDMDHIFKFASPPGFSSEVRFEVLTGNGGHTAYIKQQIGKYLHFMNYVGV